MTRRKVALVTGSNTGVGYETAKSLVQDHGYEVILACRSMGKGVEACKAINAEAHASRGRAVFVQAVDLANFTSVEAFAAAVNQQYDTIDVLVNNAGRNSAGDVGESDLCPVFATNFLGHFLLTRRLLDKCQRVVNVASVMHHFPLGDETDNIDQVDFWKRVARGQLAKTYGPSELAALLFSLELNRRFGKSKGIRSIAVNPGAV
jgi:NAD(P)-dependent dehydrogenase (short-subunit alcohol dehydrogenase family)